MKMTPQETQRRINEGLECLRALREHWKEIATPVNILVADDDPDFCLLLSDTLAEILNRRCVLFQASTGRQTIAALSRNEMDMLFLDLRMPDGNGIDVIKALPANHSMIVLCVTGIAEESREIAEARALGYRVIRKYELMDDLRAIFGVNCADCPKLTKDKLNGIVCQECP